MAGPPGWYPPPPPPPLPPGPAYWGTPPPPRNWAAERAALAPMRTASLLWLVAQVAGAVVTALFFLGAVNFGAFTTTSTSGSLNGILGTLELVFLAAAIEIVVGIVGLVYYLRGFRALARADPDGFSSPSTLVVLGIVGLVIVAIGLAVIVAGVASLSGCTAVTRNSTLPNGTASNCIGAAFSLLAAAGVILLGAALTLAGIIGLIIGLYRVGGRYGSTLLQVGGILLVIPFVGVVAPLLVYLGIGECLRHAEDGPKVVPSFPG